MVEGKHIIAICTIIMSTRKKGRGRMDTYLSTIYITVGWNMYRHGIRVRPDILVSIYGRVLVSNMQFRNTEKLLEGKE